MKSLKCSSCGADINVEDGYQGTCPYCGTKYLFERPKSFYNSTDNYESNDDMPIYEYSLRARQHVSEQNSGTKDRTTAIILCACFGFLGAHKFYEEKYVMGILYLLTMGLFGVGIIVDIMILITKPRYYNPKD